MMKILINLLFLLAILKTGTSQDCPYEAGKFQSKLCSDICVMADAVECVRSRGYGCCQGKYAPKITTPAPTPSSKSASFPDIKTPSTLPPSSANPPEEINITLIIVIVIILLLIIVMIIILIVLRKKIKDCCKRPDQGTMEEGEALKLNEQAKDPISNEYQCENIDNTDNDNPIVLPSDSRRPSLKSTESKERKTFVPAAPDDGRSVQFKDQPSLEEYKETKRNSRVFEKHSLAYTPSIDVDDTAASKEKEFTSPTETTSNEDLFKSMLPRSGSSPGQENPDNAPAPSGDKKDDDDDDDFLDDVPDVSNIPDIPQSTHKRKYRMPRGNRSRRSGRKHQDEEDEPHQA